MRTRVASAFIDKDSKGYLVNHRGTVSFRGGKKACKRECGRLNKAAALRKDEMRLAVAERSLWREMNAQEIRDFNGFKRARPTSGGKLKTGRATIRRGILNEDNMRAFLDALEPLTSS